MDEKILSSLITRSDEELSNLEKRIKGIVSDSQYQDHSSDSATLSRIKENLGEDNLAELMYSKLCRIDLPAIKLGSIEISAGLKSGKLDLVKEIYGTLLRNSEIVDLYNPDLLPQYEAVLTESRIRHTSVVMLSGLGVREGDDMLEAIKSIEPYIAELPESDKSKIRMAMRVVSPYIVIAAGYMGDIGSYVNNRVEQEKKNYAEKVREVDQEINQ